MVPPLLVGSMDKGSRDMRNTGKDSNDTDKASQNISQRLCGYVHHAHVHDLPRQCC